MPMKQYNNRWNKWHLHYYWDRTLRCFGAEIEWSPNGVSMSLSFYRYMLIIERWRDG